MSVLRFATSAEQDLNTIENYIAQDNADAALRVVISIRRKCQLLSQHPKLFAPQLKYRNFRKSNIGPYLIFYRTIKGGIEIARILHSARDLRDIFKT